MNNKESEFFLIADSHSDVLTAENIEFESYIKDISKSNVRLLDCAIWTTKKGKEAFDFLPKIDQNDVELLFSIEDLGCLKMGDFGVFERFNFFCASLTWNFENLFAGGVMSNAGISVYGKELIKVLTANGIVLDLAHLNDESVNDAINFGNEMLCVSHTCCRKLFAHPRNITDAQMKEIAKRGGYIGIMPVSKFLNGGENATCFDYVRHIDHAICTAGINYVGIGSDFFGASPLNDLENYQSYSNIVENFRKIGYNETDIEKVLFQNFKEFINRTRRFYGRQKSI